MRADGKEFKPRITEVGARMSATSVNESRRQRIQTRDYKEFKPGITEVGARMSATSVNDKK